MGVLSKIKIPFTVLGRSGLQLRCSSQNRLFKKKFMTQTQSLEETTASNILKGETTTINNREMFSSSSMLKNFAMDASVKDKLVHFTMHTPTPISIQQFLTMGKFGAIREEDSFLFLFNEMATRLAHTILDLHRLPIELLEMKDCQLILDQYTLSFTELLEFQDRKPDDDKLVLEEFNLFLQKFTTWQRRHTVTNMSNACMNMVTQRGLELNDATFPLSMSIKYYLDRLYTSMISLQMISSQHLACYVREGVHPNKVGVINPNTHLTSVLVDCYDDAAFACENTFLVTPQLIIKNYNSTNPYHDVNEPVSGVHIPDHLYTIFSEVLKNSMRATVEHNWDDRDNLPPIKVIVCQSNDDFTIKISDQGGGVARHKVENMFFYLYSTKTKEDLLVTGKSPGCGLPLAQLYARYFHGDLRMASYEGYGTDVYIYIRALASTAVERLPIYDPFTDVVTSNQLVS